MMQRVNMLVQVPTRIHTKDSDIPFVHHSVNPVEVKVTPVCDECDVTERPQQIAGRKEASVVGNNIRRFAGPKVTAGIALPMLGGACLVGCLVSYRPLANKGPKAPSHRPRGLPARAFEG